MRSLKNCFQKIVAATTVTSIVCITGTAQASITGVAEDYNLFLTGDWTQKGADTEGKVAVGGNVNFSNGFVSVGTRLTNTFGQENNLVIGGNYTGNGAVFGGNTVVGGTKSGNIYYNQCNGAGGIVCNTQSGNPIDFAAAATYYQDLSTNLASLSATGTVSKTANQQLTFTDTNTTSGSAVFAVDSISAIREYIFNVSAANTLDSIIVNIAGKNIDLTSGIGYMQVNGSQNISSFQNVIWNFFEAETISLNSGLQWNGSILAPDAAINASQSTYGNINGQVIAKSVNSQSYGFEFHDYKFTGKLNTRKPEEKKSVPEPTSLLALLAVSAVGSMAFKTKQTKAIN